MSQKYYTPTSPSLDLPQIEKKVLEYWYKKDIFRKSVDSRSNAIHDRNSEFVFYDGPPFANGLPHYGHLLTGFIKDSVARFQTNIGKKVERKFGWDCHGLPAEMAAEKELKISGRKQIIEYGIKKFNDYCRDSVMRYTNEWKDYVHRQARWVDFNGSYKTMDKNYMESVIWAFKELYKKGYLYEDMRVMPYSWACETPLSNFETRLDNSYRERADKSVTVSFNIISANSTIPGNFEEYRIWAWTTTPWTLPSNLSLAVNPDMEYVIVGNGKVGNIIAKFAYKKYLKELGVKEEDKVYSIKGRELKNIRYEPLFPYFKEHKNGFQILIADFVEEGDGTGIVHMAPGFGEDDQIICANNNIKLVCPVDSAGLFTEEVKDFAKMHVFDANEPIIIQLKKQGNWIKTEQYVHNYPHCWRTDTPLIYKAVPSWYVKVTEFKDRMVELNKEINWVPSHIKDGLFGKWLENARDWSISRNRFWGTPIPVWKSDSEKYPRIDVYGSIKEIEKDFNVKITDLHKHELDKLERTNPDDPSGKSKMRRIEDVFDCWFESGSMPYGQAHYPFENKEWFENNFPADFIVEYTAQTRGWFYTLVVLSTAIFDKPPFLNCICHGVILDEQGQKLSKRLNNYANPLETFNKFGSDSLRYTMLSSSVAKGSELLIDKQGKMVYDSLRLGIKPIWNAYHFFTLYANSDKVECKIQYQSQNILDQYIISKLALLVREIHSSMESYDIQKSYLSLNNFLEVLNNWYIRRSRNRFWKHEQDQDKQSAYNTLFTCLDHMSRAACSLLPVIFEEVYQGIHRLDYKDFGSVHLTNFPINIDISFNKELVNIMDQVIDICSVSLFVRNKLNIRIRQPLNSLKIITDNANLFRDFDDIIKDEINVKNVEYIEEVKSYTNRSLKINFPKIGKRIPDKIKDIIKASKENDWKIEDEKLIISGEKLSNDEYDLQFKSKEKTASETLKSGRGIIILDTTITDELYHEGIARDVIRHIQQARKEAALDVSDRIKIEISTEDKILKSIHNFSELIESQTLSVLSKVDEKIFESQVKIEDVNLVVKLEKLKS